MPRVKLGSGLPPKTPELKRFEAAMVELNRFYWTYVCSLDVAVAAATNHSRLSEFVPSKNWKQLDISTKEFVGHRKEVELLARYSFLTQSITYFEDYLASVLKSYLITRFRQDKMYSIKLRLNEIPSSHLDAYVRQLVAEAEIRGIMDAKYTDRMKRVKYLLAEHGTFRNVDVTMPDDSVLTAAHEARHCIVHTAAIVDARAAASLTQVFSGIRVGDRLPLDEPRLRVLLGAVRDGARAVDVALRMAPKVARSPRKSTS